MKDTLFANDDDAVTGFRFGADVVRVFPDMLDRSIPGYASIVRQTGLLAARFARPDTALLDLGCSLGASALAMRAALAVAPPSETSREREAGDAIEPGLGGGEKSSPETSGIRIHAIDSSAAMIERARELVAEEERAAPPGTRAPRVLLHEADLAEYPLPPCSVVAMNFTLQFIAPAARAALLTRIGEALVPGGALILSEKVRFADPALDALHVDMHHAFKRANGYSATEVARKRAALEDVLVPDTFETHHARLIGAGFSRSSVWFQCFNFASLVAIRD